MDARLRADWTLSGPFWQDFFPLPNVRSWLQHEKPKSCKKKCSKWVYRKWILEYLELNETYLLFGWNSQNSHLILTLLDFHTDHTALKKCSAILAKKASRFHLILCTPKSIFYIPTLSTFFCNFWAFRVEVRTSRLAEEKSPAKKGPRGSSRLDI